MEKSLSLDIHKSKQRNLSSKVLLLFAFLFFHNLSSQIYVKDSSLLTITDAAFVSPSSQNPIPTKIHISGNVIVTNIDAFSNAEIVEIRNSVLPKHRITHSVKTYNFK